MIRSRFSTVVFTIALMIAAVGSTALATPVEALDDARVAEVVTMVEGGLSQDLILAKVEDIGQFPPLSASDLVTLKKSGVPEKVLLRMLELKQLSPPPPSSPAPPTSPAPAPPKAAPTAVEAPPAPSPSDTTIIRVDIDRPFRINYYEVAVDGEVVAHKGTLWQGESEPGFKLKRPGWIGRGKADTFTALEIEVEPGEHEVAVGYAVSWVRDDADGNDDWGEFATEFYLTRGVRAIAEPEADPKNWFAPSSVPCTVEPGQTCVVTAGLTKKAPTALGGLPVYGVAYAVD